MAPNGETSTADDRNDVVDEERVDRRSERSERRDARQERRRENRLSRIDAKLKQAVRLDVMDQDEADVIYDNAKFSSFIFLLPILFEIIQMLVDWFNNRE